MNKDLRMNYSEEFLNSFVDNQLSAEEKSQAYLEIGQDPELNRQVCELRKMHDLVQLAYQNVPPPPAGVTAPPIRRRGMGVAAAVLLALGVALGMQLGNVHNTSTPAVTHAPSAALPARAPTVTAARRPASAPVVPATVQAAAPDATPVEHVAMDYAIPPRAPMPAGVKNKVLIHLTDDKSSQLNAALDEIEGLMRYYRDSNQTAHVEVVMNGRGLDLVRADITPHAARVAQLQREYRNLTFAACQNTIDRLKREQDITVRLLPGVITIDSGMAEIMRRQNQGWTYLQV